MSAELAAILNEDFPILPHCLEIKSFSLPRGSTALVGQDLLSVAVSRSYSDTPHSVGLLWTSDRPLQRPLRYGIQHLQETFMPPAGLEPAIPASERPQNNALDRAATGIDKELIVPSNRPQCPL